MTRRVYRKLPGMEMEFVSGKLERDAGERAIFYEVTFDLKLDFLNFRVMANQFIANYLDNPINAIRPELTGLAYHYSYNYFFDAAGNISNNPSLFALFSDPGYYMDQWASDGGPIERRYGKPSFTVVGNQLRITIRQYFRLDAGAPPIEIGDLPFISFEWALNLMEGHVDSAGVAPVTMVVLMYTQEDFVDVGGNNVFRGTRYLDNPALSFGPITAAHILVAS
ncbi:MULTISPECIES: hypothetical protein [unclassified Pseudomonas]|uniref:hypothetical protein n=1 Tax=unclassified Pseudomonas TaxID=196821 RepID=UPI000A1E7D4C|nr:MULTISPECIES: hypothetical protein [unclassified Pseudomonas]